MSSMSVNNNIASLNAWRNLTNTNEKIGSTMEKLSSGLRINKAADDPAGLVISEKMRAQLTGLSAATKNVEKAVNMIGTTEAALDKVNTLLSKMRTLAVDSANLGVSDSAMLKANQDELDQSIDSVTRIANFTQFGTIKLLDGSMDGAASGTTAVFQVGANENQSVYVDIQSTKAADLGVVADANGAGKDLQYTDALGAKQDVTAFGNLQDLRSKVTADSTHTAINTSYDKGVFAFTAGSTNNVSSATTDTKADSIAQAIAVIDKSIDTVSSLRGKLGAIQSDNLSVNLDALRVSYENLQSAESTIRDTDMSAEMAKFTKYQIMMQAGTAMLSQANQLPNNVLQLLR